MCFLRFICLGFTQLIISVGLCLSPNLGSFSHYFFEFSFSPTFSRLLLVPWQYECWIICSHATGPCLCLFLFSFFFPQSIFSLLFRIDKFYYSVFKFTNLPSVISTLLLNPHSEFLISLTVFLLRFHLGPFYNFYFFSNILYFLLQENLQLVIKAFL